MYVIYISISKPHFLPDLLLSSPHLPAHLPLPPSDDTPAISCDPSCHWVHIPRPSSQHRRPSSSQLPQLVEQLTRETRSPGYLLRTRKSEENAGLEDEDEEDGVVGARVARSDKYLFRVRKDGSSAPQV